MVFAPVDPAIREKVISAHLAGHGRNQITRELNEQGIKISHGSVSNFINAYKRQHEQQSQPLPSQQTSSNTAINTSTTFNTIDGSPFFTAHSTGDGQTVPSNSILANWPVSFKNTVNTDVISTGPLTSFLKNTMTDSPSSYTRERLNSLTLEEPTFMSSEAQIDIKPTTNYSHVNSKNAAPEEEEFEQPQPRSRPSLSNSENPSVTLAMDWDENHLTRFHKIMMDDKRYVQEEKRKLEEQREMLYQERSFIEEQKMVIEKREKKLAEVAELIPSAKALKDIGMGFEQAIVFIDCIKEKAQKEMIDEKAAAWRLAQELRQWQEFGALEKAISTATNQLSLLNTTLEQQKQAIATLVYLQKMGMTEAEIGQLVKLVGGWSGMSKNNGGNITTNSSSEFVGGKKLDDKLIGVGD